MMPATAESTSSAASRLQPRKAAKRASKSALRASSRSGMDHLAKALQPAADLYRSRLQCRSVDGQARGNLGDAFDLHKAVGLQRCAGRDQIDDPLTQSQRGS